MVLEKLNQTYTKALVEYISCFMIHEQSRIFLRTLIYHKKFSYTVDLS